MSRYTPIMLALVIAACAPVKVYDPATVGSTALSDCTTTRGKVVGNPALNLPSDQRRKILDAATLWAIDNGYFPCEYEMCGAVYDHSSKAASVYVTYLKDPSKIIIGPEAMVRFELPSLRVTDQLKWHGGCRRHEKSAAVPNQPLHYDASGGLTAAVVAGERQR